MHMHTHTHPQLQSPPKKSEIMQLSLLINYGFRARMSVCLLAHVFVHSGCSTSFFFLLLFFILRVSGITQTLQMGFSPPPPGPRGNCVQLSSPQKKKHTHTTVHGIASCKSVVVKVATKTSFPPMGKMTWLVVIICDTARPPAWLRERSATFDIRQHSRHCCCCCCCTGMGLCFVELIARWSERLIDSGDRVATTV